MKEGSLNYRNWMAFASLLAITTALGVSAFRTAISAPTPMAAPDANLSSEVRILDSYLNDVNAFDKKCALLGKKVSLTSAEFDPAQREADDLKRRAGDAQNALREAIRKLKVAGQWDDLDATVLARLTAASSQAIHRELGFKAVLEETAADLAQDASEISQPLDALRKKLATDTQTPIFDRDLSRPTLRTVSVSYSPVVVRKEVRCRMAYLVQGLGGAFSSSGQSSRKSQDRVDCYCSASNPDACARLAAE